MSTSDEKDADVAASGEAVKTDTVQILRPGKKPRTVNAEQFSTDDDESSGFDPYDTASLYKK